MEILISVVAKIVECTVEPVVRELGYVCFIRGNFQKLKSRVERLKDTRESVQRRVHNARRNAEDIKPVVEKWLSEVDDIIGKSEAILVNEGRHGRLCSTNLVQRHKLSRKARKMADEVLEMKNDGENFCTVAYEVAVSLVETESSLPKRLDFLDFESRKSTIEQIMDALCDDNVHMVGVFGMGGVGKTMLVKEIVRKIIEKKSFDEVVISAVSQTPNLKSIQGQLADKLGLKLEQETIEGRALRLQKRLKMEKHILVVLDDVWEYIDLETVGIPSVEDHTGCKILFISRDEHLISNYMCIDKIFEIKVLGEDESWNLFKAMGSEIVEACELKPIAIQIVRQCAGLPIAITIVAKALRNKSSPIWKDALEQLKSRGVAVNIRGMREKVYSSLKLSYDYLECEEVKLLFLLCSMFPEDIDIDVEQLQIYAMGMAFLHGVDTVAQERRRITKLVDDLISSSLLLPSDFGNNCVKMHDMVRDVAISIASMHDHICTLSYVKGTNEEWEQEKFSSNHTAVSLDIQSWNNNPLPKLMLPKVQLLSLTGSSVLGSEYVSMTENFFEEMKELKGLILETVKVSLLPPSLYYFDNIRLLRLHYCQLVSIDMIGELKKLEILDFSGSNIVEIPTSISQLTQLKVLNLRRCNDLKVVPPNILSKLTKLEELNLETFDRWEGEQYRRRKNASVSELRYLSYLYDLDLIIKHEKIVPKHLFSAELNLEKFNITIGSKARSYGKENHGFLRILDLKMECGSCLDDWKKMLKRSEEVHLAGSICTKALHLELLDENEFSHLKHLYLSNDLKLPHFINEKNKPLQKWLSKLEYLKLEKLDNLESIIHGYTGESPFNKLRTVIIMDCNKLETLFFNCTLEQEQVSLPDLEQLRVDGANNLKMMWGNIHIANSFSKLKEVEIFSCNNLEKVFPPNMMSRLTWLSILKIKKCSLLERVFEVQEPSVTETSIVMLQNLRSLELCDLPNLEYLWSKNNPCKLLTLENITTLSVRGCSKLKGEYLPSIKSLKQLEALEIDIRQLTEALGKEKSVHKLESKQFENSEVEASDCSELFPKLKSLKLYGSLDYSLTHLPMEMVQILHRLKEFVLEGIYIEEILPIKILIPTKHHDARSEIFRSWTLYKLPKLRRLWAEGSQNNAPVLQDLNALIISQCEL
ncbi:disease resistance protein At4g27190-like isoform X2 [Benincasa hispida]|uniref:disease resistance protein At4g27190-like isoform X2 n=1 Tax=Benincasa hispida TaxID=102211 RepID=UPI001902030F|nr:disease resistance protein At4g27190-like isoform X2 [Benincasa hispida]